MTVMVLGIPILLIMIFAAVKNKIADIVVGSIFIIGGLVFNIFIHSDSTLSTHNEELLTSGAYLIIGIGIICIIIGIVRFIAEKNKPNKEISKNL